MAQDHSFDVVSDFDHQELTNAVDQAEREIGNRYDFKDITKEIKLEKEEITVTTAGDMQLRAIKDILQSKFHKRGIDIRVLDPQKPEDAAKGNMRQVFKLRRGIKRSSPRSCRRLFVKSTPRRRSASKGTSYG